MSNYNFTNMQRSKSKSKPSYMDNSTEQQKQEQNEHSSKKPIRYNHGYTPIKPIRQLLKNTCCLTALSNVECQIETLKTNCSMGIMIVKEMFRFKFDEDKIWVYKCDKPLPFSITKTPQCPLDSHCYSHDSLPKEYWGKYENASRFMNIVRRKLPMITYCTDVAKAVLFDLPDLFEVQFFADLTRVIYNGHSIRIIKASGEELNVTDINLDINLINKTKSLLDKANEMYEKVKREIYPKNYPKVIGQKPNKQSNQI